VLLNHFSKHLSFWCHGGVVFVGLLCALPKATVGKVFALSRGCWRSTTLIPVSLVSKDWILNPLISCRSFK